MAGGVRLATRRDIEHVVALWIALTEYHAATEPLFVMRARAEDEVRRIVEAQLRDPDTALFVHGANLHGANVHGADAALTGLCIVRVDRAPPIHAEVCRGEITDLFVVEAVRRSGVGRALTEAAIAWAREQGAERIEVRVASDNQRGQDFWRASGFGAFMDVLHRRL